MIAIKEMHSFSPPIYMAQVNCLSIHSRRAQQFLRGHRVTDPQLKTYQQVKKKRLVIMLASETSFGWILTGGYLHRRRRRQKISANEFVHKRECFKQQVPYAAAARGTGITVEYRYMRPLGSISCFHILLFGKFSMKSSTLGTII